MANPVAEFGANEWLVDEMYERYLADPGSVSESWRDFFADYRRDADHMAPPAPGRVPSPNGGAADATARAYPQTDEARHRLHVAVTRSAHQLWVVSFGLRSKLLSA